MKEFFRGLAKGLGVETGKQLFIVLAPIILSLLREVPVPQIESMFSFVPTRIWYYAVALSLSANIVLFSLHRSLKKRVENRLDKFEFVTNLGIYRHKVTGEKYCPSCLLSDPPIESPLCESDAGWQCQRKSCEKFYHNPDFKEPPAMFISETTIPPQF